MSISDIGPVINLPTLCSKVLTVDKVMAQHLRTNCHFERQRPLDPKNIERLAKAMQDGSFIRGTPIFMAVMPDETLYILNGNHTLEAVILSDISYELTFIFHRVSNIEEAARIYINFDIQKVRSWGVALLAAGLNNKIPMASRVLPAVNIINDSFEISSQATVSRQTALANMEKYATAAHLLNGAWENVPTYKRNFFTRAGFMAVALFTFDQQPTLAEKFWGGAANDDGLGKTDPRKVLLEYSIANKSGSRESRNKDIRAAAICWNAYFEGRELQLLQPTRMVNVSILGTTWSRGKPVVKIENVEVAVKKKPSKAAKVSAEPTEIVLR